jgi:hypothetical protein
MASQRAMMIFIIVINWGLLYLILWQQVEGMSLEATINIYLIVELRLRLQRF